VEDDGLSKQPCLVEIIVAEELSRTGKLGFDDLAFSHGKIRLHHGRDTVVVNDEDPVVRVEGPDPYVALLPVLVGGG